MWGTMAAVAVSYLLVVLARPDLISGYLPLPDRSGLAEPNGARANVAIIAEVETLQESLQVITRDIAELRGDIERTQVHNRVLAQRVATLDGMPAPVLEMARDPGAVAPDPNAPPPPLRLEPAPVLGPLAAQGTSTHTIKSTEAPPIPQPNPERRVTDARVINAPATEGASRTGSSAGAIETGSVKTAAVEPPAFSAPVVKPVPKSWALQIATGSSLDSLRLSWSLLSETQAQSFKNLEPRYATRVDQQGLVYSLMAGPVSSEAEGKKMCEALSAKAIPCSVINDFGGAALQ